MGSCTSAQPRVRSTAVAVRLVNSASNLFFGAFQPLDAPSKRALQRSGDDVSVSMSRVLACGFVMFASVWTGLRYHQGRAGTFCSRLLVKSSKAAGQCYVRGTVHLAAMCLSSTVLAPGFCQLRARNIWRILTDSLADFAAALLHAVQRPANCKAYMRSSPTQPTSSMLVVWQCSCMVAWSTHTTALAAARLTHCKLTQTLVLAIVLMVHTTI